ncbi:MAG TPA: hypothetical protein VH054_13920, partial [Polyangiaceae bacterium]|nr:hypothetical protein [Polyangiaceae bacterium]
MSRAAVFIFALACSAPPPSPGLDAPTIASVGCPPYDTNPSGACYPQGNSEQVVPNDSYAGADGSFRLAQLYDPEQRFPARLIHIAVLPTWMGPANEEADFITGSDSNGSNTSHVSWASELSPKVVFIVVVPNAAAASGPPIT